MGALFCDIDDELELVRTVAAAIGGVRFCGVDDDLALVLGGNPSTPDEQTARSPLPLCLPWFGPVSLALVRALGVDEDR